MANCEICYGCDGPANCQNHCECHENDELIQKIGLEYRDIIFSGKTQEEIQRDFQEWMNDDEN